MKTGSVPILSRIWLACVTLCTAVIRSLMLLPFIWLVCHAYHGGCCWEFQINILYPWRFWSNFEVSLCECKWQEKFSGIQSCVGELFYWVCFASEAKLTVLIINDFPTLSFCKFPVICSSWLPLIICILYLPISQC